MNKRRLIPVLVIACLAGSTAIAQAAVPNGTYAGKLSDGGKVWLSVSKSQKLVKITRQGMLFTCTDGDSFKSSKRVAKGSVDVADGDFTISDTNQADSVTWKMTGTFSTKKRKVKGTYSETRTYNASDEPDPNGTVSCSTGDLSYSAALPKKK